MIEGEAHEILSAMVAAESEPTLAGHELDLLLDAARRADTDGVEITDATWTATYDLNAAAAEGWRMKAGKVAGQFSFTTDGQTFQRAEMYKACLEMAQRYANRVCGSIPLAPRDPYADVVAN